MNRTPLGCSDVGAWFDAYQDGRLSPDRSQAVFDHLMSCTRCHDRYWQPWYERGGRTLTPRGATEEHTGTARTPGSVTLTGGWTVETAYKLVAAETGTVGRTYGILQAGPSARLLKVHAARDPSGGAEPGVHIHFHSGNPPVPEQRVAAWTAHVTQALDDLGLTPPWPVLVSVEYRLSYGESAAGAQPATRAIELPVAVAVASCVLELPIPADMVFTGAIDPGGRLSSAEQKPPLPLKLPRGTRLISPPGTFPAGGDRTLRIRRCQTLADVLDLAGPVQPPSDGPVWCTPTLEPGRAFPPADESVETTAVTMIRLMATLPGNYVAIEMDRRACGGTWWLVAGGRVGLAAVAGPDVLHKRRALDQDGADGQDEPARVWEDLRPRILDATTVTSPAVELWVERAIARLSDDVHKACTGFTDGSNNRQAHNGPLLPWLLQTLAHHRDSALPYLPFPMALELAKALNEVHPDWFPPPVMEEMTTELSEESLGDLPQAGDAPTPDGARDARPHAGDAPQSDRHRSSPAGPSAPAHGAEPTSHMEEHARAVVDELPVFVTEDGLPVLPPDPRVEPPRLDHLGVALPQVPIPRYLEGYYLELAEDGEIGPTVGVPIARIHVTARKGLRKTRTTIRLQAMAPGLTVDRLEVEPGAFVPLSGYHVVQCGGVRFRIEPGRTDVTGSRPYLALVMIPGPCYPVRGRHVRIGRDGRSCTVPLPDRQTTVNLVWKPKALRSDTVILGRHRMRRDNCFLDGFEVGSQHAEITRDADGYRIRTLRPFPVYVLQSPPEPLKAVGKRPVRLHHQDRLLIGHDLFQFKLS